MSGIPVTIPGPGSTTGLQMGFFFKMSYTANIGTQIILVQLTLPGSGYISVFLNANATVTGTLAGSGGGGNWSSSVTSGAISIATWYYATYCLGYSSPNLVERLYIYQNGVGFYDSGQSSLGAAPTADLSVTSALGVGALVFNNAVAFAGFQNFPNLTGCEISKFWLRNANSGTAWGGPTGGQALTVPTADASISGMSPVPLVFYNCRQTIPVLSAPATPVPTTASTGGTVANGAYGVELTYVNPAGETTPSAAGTVTATGSNVSTLTIPAPGASGTATGWYAYVTQVGGSTYTRQQTAGAPSALNASLVLTAPPSSSGAAPPGANTALTVSSTLTDNSGNSYNATAGPNSLQILTDGPYA